jgi:hypothetical protein
MNDVTRIYFTAARDHVYDKLAYVGHDCILKAEDEADRSVMHPSRSSMASPPHKQGIPGPGAHPGFRRAMPYLVLRLSQEPPNRQHGRWHLGYLIPE